MEALPHSHLEKGTLLIATPEVESGIFFRSVALLCEHSPGGSFAIIINKPLDLELPEEIMSLDAINSEKIQTRAGGPVQTNQMMLLHNCNTIPEQTIEICEGVFLGGDLQFLQESATSASGPILRLCFGYTGWQGGQLEREFLDGRWFLYPANSNHIFDIPPQKLWPELLREMGGRFATLSMIPEDLNVN